MFTKKTNRTKSTNKIGFAIMLFVIAGLVYLSVALSNEDNDYSISLIEIDGNVYLSKEEYYKFANFNDTERFDELSLPVIRDRIQKHPYVKSVEVEYEGYGKVSVHIKEKLFNAVLLADNKNYLISDELELVPLQLYTQMVNYPVIINPKDKIDYASHKYLTNKSKSLTGIKIVSAVKLINPELYDLISDVDLSGEENISLRLTTSNYEIRLTEKDYIRQLSYLSEIWNRLKTNVMQSRIEYVDLRFNQHVFIGFKNDDEISGEIRSWRKRLLPV